MRPLVYFLIGIIIFSCGTKKVKTSIGKNENLNQVINNNFEVVAKGYNYRDRKVEILEVELINKSVAPMYLNYIGEFTFHNDYKYIELKPKSRKIIYIKTISNL